jgi:hypothetical protein
LQRKILTALGGIWVNGRCGQSRGDRMNLLHCGN